MREGPRPLGPVLPLTLIAAILVLAALGGCAIFRSKKRLDMGGFAEDMIALAGEIQYNLGQAQPVYLRDSFDTAEIDTLMVGAARAKVLVRGVIAYSIQLVSVGDSRRSDTEKAAALAEYLAEVLPAVVETSPRVLEMSRAEVDTLLANVRAQTTFLGAIEAAQPLVDEIALASERIFDMTKRDMDAALGAVRRRIEERYRDVRFADRALEQRQLKTVFNLGYLAQVRQGQPGAIDSLLVHEPSIASLVDADDGLDAAEIQLIEDRMVAVLSGLREIRDQLRPDLEIYLRKHHELDELRNVWYAELRKARVAIVAWARGHKRMAAGVIDPAEIDVRGIARKASGSLLPIP
jgi:hypothetical protein